MTHRRPVLVVFAKQPVPGRVKTRMAPPLSLTQACELYAALLHDVLQASARIARELELEPVLTLSPGRAAAEVARRAPPGFRVVAQRGLDLAQRMGWAAREAFAAGAPRVLLRGSDSPVLDVSLVGQALLALDDADVAVSPDRDGGYGLIGLRRAPEALFDHPMSTDRVLEDTLRHARRAGLRTCRLTPSFDLDTVADLRWLAEARRAGHTSMCQRTLAFLDEHDLWRLVDTPAGLAT